MRAPILLSVAILLSGASCRSMAAELPVSDRQALERLSLFSHLDRVAAKSYSASDSEALQPSERAWLDKLAARLPLALNDNDFRSIDPDKAALGRLLFHDRVLSGNRNIACATCHHATLASADGQSLGVGEGGVGLGPQRGLADGRQRLKHRVPRHSPALFNLGAYEFTVLFHDGRVSVDPDEPSGFDSPAAEFLPTGLPSVLSAQVLFPVLSEIEMAGAADSNAVAGAVARRSDHGWREIERRLRRIDAYIPLFQQAWPSIDSPEDIGIAQVAHALDDFINAEWRATGSAYDAWLAGDAGALDARQIAGAELFYGKARCASCHSGALQTDHDFHALMLPLVGPGRTRAFDTIGRDAGRMNVTDRLEDAYRFRTPSLRNVSRTAPYGHNGSFATLEGIVRHHLDPVASMAEWDREQLVLLDDANLNLADFLVLEDRREVARYKQHLDIEPVELDDIEIVALIAFLESLTDHRSLDGTQGPPDAVPSRLPVD